MTACIINHAHKVLGHLGALWMVDYIHRWYWWPGLSKEVDWFCRLCPVCQMTKMSNEKPAGLLHSLPIPQRPWNSIVMDFVGPFPEQGEHDYLWVVLCRMTSLVHLVPVTTTIWALHIAWLFVKEIVCLHGLPETIVSDRDTKFTSQFWREMHQLLGVKLLMSTAFHPQMDGASERSIRTIAQILHSMISPDQKDWVEKVSMVEFTINSSVSGSTGFAPFELTYRYMPRMAQLEHGSAPKTAPGVQGFIHQVQDTLAMALDAIIESRVIQTHHANKKRKDPPTLDVGELVYLSTKNLTLPKGQAWKLLPKYIGPMRVVASNLITDNYTIELPQQLKDRWIHPTFHVNLLRWHKPNNDRLFPKRDAQVFYDMGNPDNAEWLVDEITAHRWVGNKVEFLVKWNLGDSTWEPHAHCRDLEALDDYLDIEGVTISYQSQQTLTTV